MSSRPTGCRSRASRFSTNRLCRPCKVHHKAVSYCVHLFRVQDHLQKDADLVLICGAGGQAALAGKTLKEMGFQNVSNVGGFAAWKDAGGPVEA